MATNLRLNLEQQCNTIFNNATDLKFRGIYTKTGNNSPVLCKPVSSILSKKQLASLSMASESVELKTRGFATVSCSGNESSGGLTYKDARVDIDAGSELVRRIAKMAPGIGGFGGLFPLGLFLHGCLGKLVVKKLIFGRPPKSIADNIVGRRTFFRSGKI